MLPQCDEVTAAKSSGRPIVNSTATKSDQRVERSESSFVHSERTTRAWVTRPVVVEPRERDGLGGGRSCRPRLCELAGAELDVVACHLHERLLERGLLWRQLVQDDPVRRGRLADLGRGQPVHLEEARGQ